MSYILDALKKAERERGIAQVPTLATVHETGRAPRNHMWIVATAFLALFAAVLWMVFSWPKADSGTTAALPDAGDHRQTESQPQSSPPAENSPPLSVVPSAAPPAITSQEKTDSNHPAPYAAARIETLENQAVSDRQAPPSSRQGVSPEDIPLPEARAVGQQPMEMTASAPPPTPAATSAAPLRDAIGKMIMTVFMYAEAKDERMVFINGRKYVEGDYIDGSYLLESITEEGAVLSFQGERLLLRPQSR